MTGTFDPNAVILEQAADALRPLLDELVLVGGCAVGLLITDLARPPIRQTIDVDLVTEVAPKTNYYPFCDRLRGLGFRESTDLICRWEREGLIIDVMPVDETVLGFSNRWYGVAVQTAMTRSLRNGLVIRHVSAPAFLATKLESFYARGEGDYLHHDIEDIVNVIDGRESLADEVDAVPAHLRAFLREEFDDLLADRRFVDALPGHFRPDPMDQIRVPLVVSRLRRLAGL
ncbi:hypothetical protein [Paraburkholderia sp.]|uniref:hypothetical protein n=1 Tax=Paraburkholderia sp. TaxID=1926495 RepID=UPI0023A5FF8A|nr:hypothetical protein [Paraburkholderia sp.]MDE1180251.1 hypothetical protein [Paraburkholderia sp.]